MAGARGTRVGVTFTVLMAMFLTAAKKLSPGEALLEKCLAAAGGYSRFQRMETVSYDFVKKSPAGVKRGRHTLKLHDGLPLRAREDIAGAGPSDKLDTAASAAGGAVVTLITSSGVWRWEGEAVVKDAEALRRAREDVFEDILWFLAPGYFKEGACPVSYVGKGYLEGKLTQRIAVDRGQWPDDLWFPAAGPVTLYLNSAGQQLDGVEFIPRDGGEPVRLAFSLFADRRGHIVPLQRDFLDAAGNRTGSFSLTNVAINGFVNDKLFDPAAPRFSTQNP